MNINQDASADENTAVSPPETPVSMISYSKNSRQEPKVSEPTTEPQRKVLSHRKKLQEFYRLLEKDDSASKSSNAIPERDEAPATVAARLKEPEALDQFIKTASAREILKVRNEIALALSFHDSEKKTIIYDNYSELIKLDHTLGSTRDGMFQSTANELSMELPVSHPKKIPDMLDEVRERGRNDTALFNQDFRIVVDTVLSGPRTTS